MLVHKDDKRHAVYIIWQDIVTLIEFHKNNNSYNKRQVIYV